MNYFVTWWQSRHVREKWLMGLMLLTGMGLLMQLSLRHAEDYRIRAQQQLSREQDMLHLIPEWETRLKQHASPSSRHQEPVTVHTLNVLAQQQGLALKLVVHQDTFQLSEGVSLSFPALLQWLSQIENLWGLQVSHAELLRDKQHVRLIQLELKHVK